MARFVNVAAFAEVPKAEIARAALAEAGIRAYITDGELVAMEWLLANAIGGAKVQVAEEDAERAVEVLARADELRAGIVDDGLDDEELARQALAAAPEDADVMATVDDEPGPDELPPAVTVTPGLPVAGSDEPSERDRQAKKAFIIGWFGLAIPPLAVLALYHFISASLGTGPISARGRYNLFVAALLVVPAVFIAAIFFSLFLS